MGPSILGPLQGLKMVLWRPEIAKVFLLSLPVIMLGHILW